jgi:hypothetical protein
LNDRHRAHPRRLIRRPQRQEALERRDSAEPQIVVPVIARRAVLVPRRQHANQVAEIFDHIFDIVDCDFLAGARGGDFLLGGAQLLDCTLVKGALADCSSPIRRSNSASMRCMEVGGPGAPVFMMAGAGSPGHGIRGEDRAR